MLAITKVPTDLLYLPCALSNYLSDILGPVYRHNSCLVVVMEHCWWVQYLGCGALL